MAGKVEFKGLYAYNYVVKQVKKNIDLNKVELKKGTRQGLAPDCSYRDVVKKAWEASKGKSKRSVSKIVKGVVSDCQKAIEGQQKQKASPSPEGQGNIVDSLMYWELQDYMKKHIPQSSRVVVDNSAFGGVADKDGSVEDIEEDLSDIFGELNEISNARGWDSSSAATYSLYFDEEEGAFTFRLADNENRDEGIDQRIGNWKDRQIEEFEKLKDADLTELTGGKATDKIKPIIDVFKEEERKREQIKTREFEKQEELKTISAKIDVLEKSKEGIMKDMRFQKEMGLDKEFRKSQKRYSDIQDKLDKLRSSI